jgi:dipeptidyl-peptidase-4
MTEHQTETQPARSFPRHNARTQRFTLGAPRAVTPSADGQRVAFLRSPSGTDRSTCLWVLDVATGAERLVADAAALLGGGEEALSPEERARRERLREGAGGNVAYASDAAVSVAAFVLSSRLWLADLVGGGVRELPAAGPVLDPHPDPTGRRIAYVADGALHVVGADGSGAVAVATPDAPGVVWGLAEFIAAEEMDRVRGFWWAPDGERLLAARVDDSGVHRWWICDPANPQSPPTEVAYPGAGTPNADVRLALLALDGTRVDVPWDRERFPYLARVHWSDRGAPLLLVQSRDQRTTQVLTVDVGTGTTQVLREDTDPAWIDLAPGLPAWLPGGRLLHRIADTDTHRLAIDGSPVTPVGLQVDGVLDVTDSGVLFSATGDPTHSHVWWLDSGSGTVIPLTHSPGVHSGRAAGPLRIISSSSLDRFGAQVDVTRIGVPVTSLTSYAETPTLAPSVTLLRTGSRKLSTALLLPTGWDPGQGKLPVLMDPYGGPHALRVVAARNAFLSSQWFADQGFAVVVVDGRGTPRRGPAWEREVAFDLATPVLDDQVDALHSLADRHPELDLSRVGIRGWSFGGFLAALAVLRRPEVFHAAVAGAPVTDQRLYDTHYSERYLGLPQEHPEAYAKCSLLDDAARLERPLMLIHGLADDNVVVAHTLRLSAALLAAGRPHTVLPLSGVTHMTPQEVVAENLLLLQVDFLRQALA